jgi:nitrate reductase gamma subunit
LGAPKDFSETSGSVSAGVRYSNTGAMMPMQKESAYKHLPTYTAGILFHLGTFLAFFCFVTLIFDKIIPCIISSFFFKHTLISSYIALILWIGAFFGIMLIIKRLISKKLRPISNIDDYVSVILTTFFQLLSALLFTFYAFDEYLHQFFTHQVHEGIFCAYFSFAALLLIYLPFGKLKHVVYYFAARYHLGFFFGRRNTWPPKKDNYELKIKN